MTRGGNDSTGTTKPAARSPRRERDPDVLTAPEVARMLGVSRTTVFDSAGRGELPHRRIGRRMLFSRAAIRDWLACRQTA